MSSIVTISNLGDTLSTIKSKVIATGVALLFVYAINFIFQGLATCVKKPEDGREQALRKTLQTSQVLYWFGVATVFSTYPPFYVGTFSTIMAYITLIVVLIMHILALVSDKRAKGRSIWAIFYFLYHFLIALWIIVALILAFIWSQNIYQVV